MNIVEVRNLKKNYSLGKVLVEAVKGVDFSIEQGEFVSISGPSGSGKSTILNHFQKISIKKLRFPINWIKK